MSYTITISDAEGNATTKVSVDVAMIAETIAKRIDAGANMNAAADLLLRASEVALEHVESELRKVIAGHPRLTEAFATLASVPPVKCDGSAAHRLEMRKRKYADFADRAQRLGFNAEITPAGVRISVGEFHAGTAKKHAGFQRVINKARAICAAAERGVANDLPMQRGVRS